MPRYQLGAVTKKELEILSMSSYYETAAVSVASIMQQVFQAPCKEGTAVSIFIEKHHVENREKGIAAPVSISEADRTRKTASL
jgi:hypothetical protein